MTTTDDTISPVFEIRREAWRAIIIANLPPFDRIHQYQIDDAANELADGLYTNVHSALNAQLTN